jgi:hypothetical protein
MVSSFSVGDSLMKRSSTTSSRLSNEVELAVDGGGMSGFEACMFGTAKLKEFGIE